MGDLGGGVGGVVEELGVECGGECECVVFVVWKCEGVLGDLRWFGGCLVL